MSGELHLSSRDSAGLVRRDASQSFAQQGTIDWTSLARTSLNASVDVLARISAFNVDPYTIIVGRVIVGSLRCSSLGLERFNDAVRQSKGLASYRNVLWFGFGIKHIVHVLSATEEGEACAALLACLSECYSVSHVATILVEMTKIVRMKQSTLTPPSLQQWRDLVDSCAGLVAKSNFAIHAEHLMSLDGNSTLTRDHSVEHNKVLKNRGVASAAAIGEALSGLVDLSQGTLHQITLIGGADAAVIGAIGEWLIGLHVEIRSASNNTLLFTNYGDDATPQLLIFLKDRNSETSEGDLRCVGKVYMLPTAFDLVTGSAVSSMILGGRLPYDAVFDRTFGKDFKRLLLQKQAFGRAMGSAARIYHAIVKAEENVPDRWLQDCTIYFPESYGLAYVNFSCYKFPELEGLIGDMTTASRVLSLGDAIQQFETQMATLQAGCGCQGCDDPLSYADSSDGGSSKDTATLHYFFCLPVMVQTIIQFVRCMTGIVTDLAPTRAGLEYIYMETFKKTWRKAKGSPLDGLHKNIVSATNILELGRKPAKGSPSLPLILVAEQIFANGRFTHDGQLLGNSSAFSNNGACFFLDILREPSITAATAARVHVLPGKIEHGGRNYHHLIDGGPILPMKTGNYRPRGYRDEQGIQKVRQCKDATLDMLASEGIAFQNTPVLTLEFGISVNKKICYTIPPAQVVEVMTYNEGLVSCERKRDGCPRSLQTRKLVDALDPTPDQNVRQIEVLEKKATLIQGSMAVTMLALWEFWDPILQCDECDACCLRAGILRGSGEFTIINQQAHYLLDRNRLQRGSAGHVAAGVDHILSHADAQNDAVEPQSSSSRQALR